MNKEKFRIFSQITVTQCLFSKQQYYCSHNAQNEIMFWNHRGLIKDDPRTKVVVVYFISIGVYFGGGFPRLTLPLSLFTQGTLETT